ncbi:hypothetical protein H5410_022357 [Solanum commersonii]|uniref:Uncharacterized protein n=1 Tax=Solanum commersonii TaxID=4109 RepID=A0A9J5ZHS9_SOLCO|nr:hypothetical protein H5410_022357 [Solanum commersonii]
MKSPIKSNFLQPKSKMENKSCSLSRWSKYICRLHKRHIIKKSFAANDVKIEQEISKLLILIKLKWNQRIHKS